MSFSVRHFLAGEGPSGPGDGAEDSSERMVSGDQPVAYSIGKVATLYRGYAQARNQCTA